ncbi:MAG: WG repeat-containing protein [Bacteroidales bacterium]|nr:WG repeat-containing protein [Bacteroidales bacterium]
MKKYRKNDQYGDIRVVNSGKGKWTVLDNDGNEIVPSGRYSWIDGFDHGLARVKVYNKKTGQFKWGIINSHGEEVLPPEFDEIWNFFGKGRLDTRVVKGNVSHQFDLYEHVFSGDTRCFEDAYEYEDSGRYEEDTYSKYCDAIEGVCYDPDFDYDDEEMIVMYWNTH